MWTPNYCVSLKSTTSSCFVETRRFIRKVSKTSERIDIEKLKAREQIMFFDDVLLFEDELHDHGVSMISVKIVSPARVSTEQCHSCTSGTVALFQTLADTFFFCDMVWNIWFYLVLAMQRVMPTSFFLLLRFFLRVDGVLIRINDTRLYHEASCFSPLCSSVGLLSSVLKEAGLLSVRAAASTRPSLLQWCFFLFPGRK